MGTMAQPGLGGLLERRDELAVIRECAASVAGGEGRAVVVEGPPGIGKTALVVAARVHAREAGLTALAARGIELERAFGFGVVRQLLEPTVQDADFKGAARHAAALLDVPLAERPPLPFGPEGAFVALHSLYRLTANLARGRPLALLVDDAHWADGASLRFLAYLGNRLSRVPLLLVVAARPLGEPGGAAVADMLADGGAPVLLRPRVLSDGASAELVRAAVPGASTPLCRSCHMLTGGNPFFLRELAGALREAGPERAADVLDAAPDGVVASVRARLTRFPSPAQRLAGAAAIVGDGGLLRHAAALADLVNQEAAEAADALRAGRILMDGRELRFVHPIVRSAVHEQLSPAARSAGHKRAAQMLDEEDAPAERVAAHLLATEPHGSDWVCDRLRGAAREAVPHGAPDASVTYLRRALEEPPSPDSRPAVLLELGVAESLTLDREPAIEHLRRGVETTQDTGARLSAARTLAAMVGTNDPSQSVEILERALAASPDASPALALDMEAHMLGMARLALSSRRATFERAARLRERVEAGELDGAMELTVAATELTMAGEPAERAADLATRAIAALRAGPIVVCFAVWSLSLADRLDEADRILSATIDEARRHRANYRVGPVHLYRSDVRFRAGALRDAVADAEAALTAYAHAGRLNVLGSTAALVQALTERGDFRAADAALRAADADGPPDAIGDAYSGTLVLGVRARLRLAQGDPQAALADLLEVARRQEVMREPNPAAVHWRSHAALAHATLDQRNAALVLAREELDLARRYGAARAIGIALRTLGVIGDELDAIREAVEVLAASPARLEHAHALADLGVALRHRRRIVEARGPLREALDLAVRCGAAPLAERARTELLIAGARPRRPRLTGIDALTTNERRVAAMAADGRSNREIAQALHVSHKTVEKHLTASYRKLGIAAREDIAAALAKQ
jgi:DNA-binding CsgD family transcriptional regulator/tetratricopeptide (TPR) repeat protein